MSDTSPEPGPLKAEGDPNAPIAIDLYCLECGYNLRGLSGDPVRCPECGFLNPIGDVEIPAPIISKQLRRMETEPATSVLGLLALLLLWGVWALMLYYAGGFDASITIVCPGIPTLGALLTWMVGVFRFRSSCLGRPGWLAVLLRYQFVALMLVIAIAAVFGCALWIVDLSAGPIHASSELILYFLGGLAAFLLVVLAVLRGLRPVHRWLKAPMEQLQRQVAVKLARERIRKNLRRGRRRGSLA
jgi:hypothetical protein